MKINKKILYTIIIVLFVCVLCLIVLYFRNDVIKTINPVYINNWVDKYGVFGPIIFVLGFLARTLIMFPASVFCIAGGLTFGLWKGLLYCYIGTFLSATLSFYLSRYCGYRIVRKLFKRKKLHFDEINSRNGFFIVLYLRLFAPLDPVSIAAGLSDISYRSYIIATSIGIIPGLFVFVLIGNAITNIQSNNYLQISKFVLLILIVFGSLSLVVSILKKFFR